MQNRSIHLPPRLFAAIAVLLLFAAVAQGQSGAFVFTPPPPNIAVNSECEAAFSFGPPPTVTPTTPGAVITLSQYAPINPVGYTDPLPRGTYLVKWNVADNMGHSWEFVYPINMIDVTPPVFNSGITPSLLWVNSVLQLPILGPIALNDNCSDSIMINQTFSQTAPPPLCQAGPMTRTWVATDESGNVSTYTQAIQVFRDSLPPVITVAPVNGSAPCASLPGAYTSWLSTQMDNFTATDASGIASYTNNAPPGLASCPTPITVKFTATDACGYTKTATATFSSTDTQPPVVVVEPKDTIAFCGNHLGPLAQFIHTRAYSQVTDACSPNLTWKMLVDGTVRDSAGVVAELVSSLSDPCGVQLIGSQLYTKVRGYVRVDFFAKDICNNEVFAGQGVFGVRDTTAPIIAGPAMVTEECGGGDDQLKLNAWINAHGNANFSDNCSAVTWQNFSFTTSTGQMGAGGFNTGPFPVVQANNCNWFVDVAFRASDECGNVGSKTLRFRISDTTPPVIGGFPDTIIVYCPAAIPTTFSATATDNCAIGIVPTYTTQFADTACAGNYTLKVFWKAIDLCNNMGTRTQIFAIRDTIRPVFSLVPANITVSCDSFQLVPAPVIGTNVTATDQCGAMQGITYSTSDNRNPDINLCGHYNFEITRTFVAADKCGNTRTAKQVITVRDTKGPVSAVPLPDVGILCQNLPLTPILPAATDNCSPVAGPVTEVSQTIIAGSCPDNYTIVVTWKAKDVCGNEGFFSRNYLVSDTTRPVITGLPGNITVECDAIPSAPVLSTLVITDNCDVFPVVSFVETEVRDPNLASCDHWSNYQIKRVWTVTDACSNVRVYSQLISVMDNTPPVLSVKDTVLLPNAPGLCGTDVLPPTPLSAFDRCAVVPVNATLLDTTAITGPPSSDAVCDTVFLGLTAAHLPPLQPVQGNGVLTVFLDNADAEGTEEYFRVYGEDGVYIGQTLPTPAPQCSNGSTTFILSSNQLNDWLADGQMTLVLAPNGIGADAINPICPGRRVRAQLSYQYLDPQVGVQLSYRFDNAPLQPYPAGTATFLDVGSHTVTYVATDCVGNSVSQTAIVRIDDVQAPLIAPPAAQTVYVGTSNCEVVWPVPLPGVTENCDLSGYLMQSSPIANVKFISNANAGYVPETVTLTIPGLIPNAFTGGVLTIKHRGDNSDAGEFFRVVDELNAPLSITSLGPVAGSCASTHTTSIPVSAAQINAWAANGSAQIKLIANTDAINFSDFINPCAPLNAQGLDGISSVQVMLEYHYASLNYTIANSQQTVVKSGTLFGPQSTATLMPGNYTVNYSTTDVTGNQGVASFPLTVRDSIRPTALCQNRTIFTSATGAAPVTLTPADINNGSIDNCSGNALSFSLSQTNFTCNQSNQIIPVTLTVTDTSGNSKSCIASVNVQTDTISASSLANVCEGGTVLLFSNPPGNPSNYTFLWSGPSMYSSMTQNPVINNAQLANEGTYIVKVTGPTGCTASGITQLQLIGLPYQPSVDASAISLCAGQNLILTTNAYSGSEVSYQWYRNSIDTLISTTIQPYLNINNPSGGSYQFFVRVVDLNCGSALSAPRVVVVNTPVTASVTQSYLNPCEGDPISLGTSIQGPNLTYRWSGQGGFVNFSQYPPVFAASLTNGGNYTLVIYNNGCPGVTATVSVEIRDRPDAPFILGTNGLCVGGTLQLTAQPPVGNPFLWVSPNSDTTVITGTNEFVLNDVVQTDEGLWHVIALLNGCASPASPGHLVDVDDYPYAVVNANTPLCQGGVLQLVADVNLPVTYSWLGPDGFSAFNNPSPFDVTPVSGVYSVTVTTPNGCSATDTIQVLVVAPPVITSVTSDAPACVNGTSDIQLFHTQVSAYGPFSFEWKRGSNFFSAVESPVIPSATIANNGTYTLWVTDVYGCVSAPKSTTINVKSTPPLPLISSPAAVCEGDPFEITIVNANDYINGDAIFSWNLPVGGTFETAVPMYSGTNASLNNNGFHSVEVSIAGCPSNLSASIFLQVNDRPSPPILTINTPVCEGDTIFFEAVPTPGVPLDNLTFMWMGPVGFNPPGIWNPFVYPAVLNSEGDYNVKITTSEGCSSSFGEPVYLTIKPRPKRPLIISDNRICISPQAADTLLLTVSPDFQTPLATYTWYNFANQMPMGPPSVSPVFSITNFSNFTAGQNAFYVVANLDGCESLKSTTKIIQFDSIPNINAYAGIDIIACVPGNFNLNAELPDLGTGFWSQLNGPAVTITNSANINPTIIGATLGNSYAFLWTLSNESCKNYSQDTVLVSAVAYQPAMARPDIDTCFATSIQLSATQGVFAPGFWSQPNSQSQLQPPIVITDPMDPNTTVSGIPPNTNNWYFVWNVSSATCGTSADTVKVFIVVTQKPNAGQDTTLCGIENCVVLNAQVQNNESGVWKSSNPTIEFLTPGSPNSEVCGLSIGQNILTWETNGGLCDDASRDDIIVNFQQTPDAVTDSIQLTFGTPLNLNILGNDLVPNDFRVSITANATFGQLNKISEGQYSYLPDIGFSGTEVLTYLLCNQFCAVDTSSGTLNACDVASIYLLVNGTSDCDGIPTVITPNGDNINDEFFIPCLSCADCIQDNELVIFNQWGDFVFRQSPYQQNWNGTRSGDDLPAGSYFYVLKYNSGTGLATKTGFVIIQR